MTINSAMSLLLPVGPELLEISNDVVDVLFLRKAGEGHFGAGYHSARVFQILFESGFIPRDPRVLVGGGIVVSWSASCLAADRTVELRSNSILRTLADLMAELAFGKDFFAG